MINFPREVFYDIETTPECFTVVFKEDGEYRRYIIGNGRNDAHEIIQYVGSGVTLIGYNSINFDNPIINRIVRDPDTAIPEALYNLGQAIINDDWFWARHKGGWVKKTITDNTNKYIRELRYPKGLYPPPEYVNDTWQMYEFLDLIQLFEVNGNRPSLKHIAIHLGWHWIQDLPYPHNHIYTPEQIEELLLYNDNDVDLTEAACNVRRKQIQLRLDLAQRFEIDPLRMLNASDSKMGNLIMETLWGGKPKVTQTHRDEVRLADCLTRLTRDGEDVLTFNEPINQALLELVKGKRLNKKNKWEYKLTHHFNGVDYAFGVGGLHSVDNARLLRSDEKFIYFEADGASFYPNLIRQFLLYPAHLDAETADRIYGGMIGARIRMKNDGDEIGAWGGKIMLNGLTGKLNSYYFWWYDRLQYFSMTLLGQFILLKLTEFMLEKGFTSISANTDGIVCKVPVNQVEDFIVACNEFSEFLNIDFEATRYEYIAQRDVNNYMARSVVLDENGEIVKTKLKTKGWFDDNHRDIESALLHKGYAAPVISMMIQDYFDKGTLPEDSIKEYQNDPHLFVFTQKVGSQFKQLLRRADGDIELQKTNRYVIYDRAFVDYDDKFMVGSYLKKRYDNGRETAVVSRRLVAICNTINPGDVVPIDYQWYIDAANGTIYEVKKLGQLSLFPDEVMDALTERRKTVVDEFLKLWEASMEGDE